MAKIILGLHGPAGAGKDTLYKLLNSVKPSVLRFKCADPLYSMAKAIDPVFNPDMTHEDKEDWLLNSPILGTRRNFLQKLGTEFAREHIHSDFWILLLKDKIEKVILEDAIVLVTDIRFENEARLIRTMGGTMIHLRPDWTSFSSDHASAHQLSLKPDDRILKLYKGQLAQGVMDLLNIIKTL